MTHDEQNNSSDTGTKVPMTYDELLAKIDDDEKFLEQYFGGKFKGQSALRAVVTLCNFLDKKGRCCVPIQEVIDAIEKELQ